jgi:hypothetical protein
MRRGTVAILVGALLAASVAAADTLVVTFDGVNVGGWTFGTPGSIPGAGGNPGAYLASGLLDTFAPQPRTTLSGSPFTGDYRAAGVSGLGLDLITFAAQTTAGRPLSLMLIHDNGTPANFSDDTAAYTMGPNIPAVGAGWVAYDFSVPSSETELPGGWLLLNLGDSGAPANHTWDQVIQSVSQVRYFYGDPTLIFIFQQWMLGLDNARIVFCSDPASGAVPDGLDVPGAVLTVRKTPAGSVILRWGNSCNSCDSDFGVYAGSIGSFDTHEPVTCSTGGLKIYTHADPPPDAYYLIVPTNGVHDGSYGRDSSGAERPPGVRECRPQLFADCR